MIGWICSFHGCLTTSKKQDNNSALSEDIGLTTPNKNDIIFAASFDVWIYAKNQDNHSQQFPEKLTICYFGKLRACQGMRNNTQMTIPKMTWLTFSFHECLTAWKKLPQ